MRQNKQLKINGGSKPRSLIKQIWRCRHVYIILLPVILYYIIFSYLPIGGNVMAFQKYSLVKGITGSKWVGLDNFKMFLSTYNFWNLLRNTLRLSIYTLVVGFPITIIFSLLLNEVKNLKFKKVVQTVTYMPHFISAVVMCSIVILFLASEGAINDLITSLGFKRVAFMTKASYFPTIYVVQHLWQSLGWSSIMFIAAIAGVDQEQYEAAYIDGAGRFRQAIHVTLPGIADTIIIVLILNIGGLLNVGTQKILLLQNPSIYETADVVGTYVYRRTLVEGGNFGYSTAISVFNSLINLALLITSNKISKWFSGKGLF
ncbi:MAG: sugar ABC transporter permease [Lachnospiraceae bacterium]|nr:sugar ABC transporter permease [Lachnospiraceae bacterium]